MDSVIQQVPEEFREIYRRHWRTIKESVKQGVLKDVYHYPLISENDSEIRAKLQDTITHYTSKLKINVAFGFILRNIITDELKFFHPSNNTMLFETPRLLKTPADYRKLIEDVEQEDAFEYARIQRPSTKWTVERIICVRFDIYKLDV